MNQPIPGPPFAETILHPTDFSEESERAFAHALAMALCQNARLIILHVGETDRKKRWTEFPSVRGMLARWGLLRDAGDRRSVSRNLDVRVKKVNLKKRHPLPTVLDYIEEHLTDLIVLATEGREGLPRWIRPSMAEAIARRSQTMTLFVPSQAHGFVSDDGGRIKLHSILVPVDHRPHPHDAVARAARVAAMSFSSPVEIVVFHAGTPDTVPEVTGPEHPFCTWSKVTREGDVVEEILRSADERTTGLIVMATEGHHGILDALRGNVTEQVVRRAPCPVLAVPVRPSIL